MIIILIALVWLSMGVGGYFLVRAAYRRDTMWTVEARNFHLPFILIGPTLIVAGLFMRIEANDDVSSW